MIYDPLTEYVICLVVESILRSTVVYTDFS